MVIGTFIIEHIVPEYQEASVPLSIISVLAAGPIEEILFFGLPFYVLGHHLIVLAGGIVWVMLHILNTDTLELALFLMPTGYLYYPHFSSVLERGLAVRAGSQYLHILHGTGSFLR